MTTIQIGGEKRPFKFGINATIMFTKRTGRSMKDLDSLDQDDIEAIVEILHAGLCQGAQMADKDIDFDATKVGLWMDDIDSNVITKAFESMVDQTNTGKKNVKKKTTA